jgi:hypothetical protein
MKLFNKKQNTDNTKYFQPAFVNSNVKKSYDGMLLLDFFAAKALQSLIDSNQIDVAEKSYKIANEMIEERKKYFNPPPEYYYS